MGKKNYVILLLLVDGAVDGFKKQSRSNFFFFFES